MITRDEIIKAMKDAYRKALLEHSIGDAETELMTAAFDAIHPLAAVVPRDATHEMLIASIKDDRNPINAAIAAGDLTK